MIRGISYHFRLTALLIINVSFEKLWGFVEVEKGEPWVANPSPFPSSTNRSFTTCSAADFHLRVI